MGMTITEKILAAHSGRDAIALWRSSTLIDLIVAHDVTTPPAADAQKLGIKVFDPTKIPVTPDHFVPNKDIKSAELAKQLREWREEQGIMRYYEIGNHGICHAIAPEQGTRAARNDRRLRRFAHDDDGRSGRSRRASARPTWPPRSPPANSGSKSPNQCSLN